MYMIVKASDDKNHCKGLEEFLKFVRRWTIMFLFNHFTLTTLIFGKDFGSLCLSLTTSLLQTSCFRNVDRHKYYNPYPFSII